MENNKELLKLAKNGDEQAFSKLVSDCLPKISSIIQSKYHLTIHDLEDIVQISTISAWNKLSSFRGDSSFSTWLFIILKNESLSHIKKKQKIENIEIQNSKPYDIENDGEDYNNLFKKMIDRQLDDSALSILEKQETTKAYRLLLDNVLTKLSTSHQEVIKLVIEDELSYREVADNLNIPIGTVMSRLYLAKQQAKKLIQQYAEKHDIQLHCLG